MKTLLITLPVLSLSFLLIGCGTKQKAPTHEDLANQSMALMDELVTAMGSVADAETAKTASETIDGIMVKMKEVKTQVDVLGEPSPEVQAMIEEKMKTKQAELTTKMMETMGSFLTNPEAAKHLGPVMEKMKDLGSIMQP